jgi:hypothetical protein
MHKVIYQAERYPKQPHKGSWGKPINKRRLANCSREGKMFNPPFITTGTRFARQSFTLLGLGLICSLPLRAVDSAPASNADQLSAVAQDTSSQQASSSSSNGAAATASANQYGTTSATTSNGATASNAQTGGRGVPAQVGGRDATAPIDPDAGWTPATYINTWLPSWLRLSGEFRNREEGHAAYGFTPGNDYGYGLFRVLLGLDITPTNWFRAFVQARDVRVAGTVPSNLFSNAKDVFDLSQAYVEFRNGENGWFDLKTGRQEMYFGDERLIGRSNWSNATRYFDAARLTLRSKEYGVIMDTFASSVVKNHPTSWDHVQAGRNFYGVNVGFTKLVPKATVEPYVYLKTAPTVTGADKKPGNERLYTSGLRLGGTIPGGFDYRARYSYQSGHLADNSIHAWAYYGILGYTLPSRFKPRFSLEYNYASGNKAIGSLVTGTFDLLYPTTHQWRRATDLFGEQNIRDLKPGFDFRPTQKLRVYFDFSDLSLASRYDSLYDTSGAVLIKVPKGGTLSRDIGKEADIYGTYDVNRRLQFGAGYGHLWAGSFLKQNSKGGDSAYPYGFIDYHF